MTNQTFASARLWPLRATVVGRASCGRDEESAIIAGTVTINRPARKSTISTVTSGTSRR